MSSPPYVVVASLLKQDAMCALFFSNLRRAPLRIVQFGRDPLAAPLSGASALIVIRGLFEFGNLIRCARRLGIPRYYFLDDNFMLIREEAEQYGSSYDLYTNDRVRATLADFSGVLLATESLISYFRDYELHPRLCYYPPVSGSRLTLPADAARPLSVAFFGGAHRRGPFLNLVYPALRRLAANRPVRLIAAGIEGGAMPKAPNLEVLCLPYNPSYESALRAVADVGVDILVHPSDNSANNIFKNPHVLINARAIGATPIFSDTAPYDSVAAEGISLTAAASEEAWFRALSTLADDAGLRASIYRRLASYCETHFGGHRNREVIDRMLAAHPQPRWPAARLTLTAPCLLGGRVAAGLRRRVLASLRS